jgi:hypothetical protein
MEHKLMTQPNRFIQYFVISATGLIGGGSLVLFLIFLYVGSFDWVNFGLKEPTVLAFDALLCFVFFVQHSTMIRKSFKNRLRKIIPSHYHGAFYSISSSTSKMEFALYSVLFFSVPSVYLYGVAWLLDLSTFLG